jgi:hypothetical protein
MPQFKIQLKYKRGVAEKWSNVWRVEAADLFTAASAAVDVLAPGVLPLLDDSASIVEALTSTPGTPGAFITAALALVGTSTGSGSILPLFNSMKVLFPILSGGRPDYKYFKGFLTEASTENELIGSSALSGTVTVLTSLISNMATAGATLVDNSGSNYSEVTPQQEVQMRQMHRRRRRTP